MSNIDNRVLQMEFDNSLFDKNVEASIETLAKLNNALKLEGIDKNLSDLSSNVNNLDFSKVGDSMEDVKGKFSKLTDYLTKGSIDFGSRIVKAINQEIDQAIHTTINKLEHTLKEFTIAPITQGFSEYELKMGSVQTIMASTGEDIGTINKYLDELNTYADKTIYSFSDMTSNIGKFTNAGVKLEDAVSAIQGISNVAAVSGANANEASRAMYNFAQALSAGYVKLIDWKSIENANMATVEFKNALIETAVELGTVVKEGDLYRSTTTDANGSVSDLFDATKNFNDALSAQWMTTEVLTTTLAKYSDENTELGEKASKAATQVKTFSQLMDTLKEAIGSGWARTFELFIGDFEQAKELFTSISDVVGGFIDNISDARNSLLEEVLGGGTKAAAEEIEETTETITKAGRSLEEYQKIANEVENGLWGNGEERVKKLTEAGYDYDSVMTLVNHDLKGWEINMELFADTTETVTKTTKKAAEASEELSEKMQRPGRELLIEAFANIAKTVGRVLNVVGKAWKDTFPPVTADTLKKLIINFHDLTEQFKFGDSTLSNIRKTFRGLFSVIKLVGDAVFGVARAALPPLIAIVRTLAGWFLTLVAPIGKFISNLTKLSTESDIFYKIASGFIKFWTPLYSFLKTVGDGIFGVLGTALQSVGDVIIHVIKYIQAFWGAFKETSGFKMASAMFSKFKETLNGIKTGIFDRITGFFDKIKSKAKIKLSDSFDVADVAEKAGNALQWLNKKFIWLRASILSIRKDIAENEDNPLHGLYVALTEFDAGGLLDNIVTKFTKAKDSVVKFAEESGLAAKAQELFSEATAKVKENAPKAFGGLRDILGKIGTAILTAKDKILEFWGAFKETEAWQIIKTGVLDAFNKLVESAKTAGGFIGEFLANAFGHVKETADGVTIPEFDMTSFANNVSEKIKWIIEKFKEFKGTAKDVFENGIDTGSGIFGTIKDFFTSIDLSNGIEGLTNSFPKAKEAIVDFFTSIKELFFGKEVQAAEVVDQTTDVTKAVNAITEDVPKAGNVLSDFTTTVTDVIDKIKGFIGDIFGEDFDKAIDRLSGIWTKLEPMLIGLANLGIVGKIRKIFKTGDKGLGNILDKVATVPEGLAGVFTKVGGTFGGITDLLVGGKQALERLSKAAAKEARSKAIRNVAIALGILAASFFALAQLSWDQVKVGAAAIGIVTAALVALMLALKFLTGGGGFSLTSGPIETFSQTMAKFGKQLSKSLSKFGTAAIILSFAAAILILIHAVKTLADMDMDVLIKGGVALGVLMLAFGLMVKSIAKAGDGKGGLGKAATVIALALGIKMLVGSVEDLGKMNPSVLVKGAVTVAALAAILTAGTTIITKFGGKAKIRTIFIILSFVAGIKLLAGSVKSLGQTPEAVLKKGLLAVLAIAAILTAAISITSISTKNAKTAPIIAMVLGIVALALVVVQLGNADQTRLRSAAISLTLVIAAVAVLAGAIGLLSKFSGIASTIVSVIAIGALLAEIIVVFSILEGMDAEKLRTHSENLVITCAALLELTAAIGILGKLGPATTALGVLDFTIIIAAFGGLFTFAGWLNEEVPGIKEKIDAGIPLMESIAEGIGKIIGAFIGGIMDGFTDSIMDTPAKIQEFAEGLKEPLETAKDLDADPINNISEIFLALAGLQITEALSNLANFLFGGEDADQSAKDTLTTFAEAVKAYSDELTKNGGIDEKAIQASSTACSVLLTLANSTPKTGGKWQEFFGESEPGEYGKKLIPFAIGLVAYSAIIKGMDTDAVEKTEKAITIVLDLAKATPETDGFLQDILGESEPGKYGQKLVPFARGLVGYSKIISRMDTNAVESTENAVKVVLALAQETPEDTILNVVLGESNPDKYGEKLVPFAKGLLAYSLIIAHMDVKAVRRTEQACTIIMKLANAVPTTTSGSILSWVWTSEKNLETFGSQLYDFADGFVKYSERIADMKTNAVRKTKAACSSIVALSNSIPDTNGGIIGALFGNEIENFATNLPILAQGFVDFSETAEGYKLEDADRIINSFKNLAEISNLVTGYFEETGRMPVEDAMNDIIDIVNRSIDELAYSSRLDEEQIQKFIEWGESVGGSVADGIKKGLDKTEGDTKGIVENFIKVGTETFDLNFPKFMKDVYAKIGDIYEGTKKIVNARWIALKAVIDGLLSSLKNTLVKSRGTYLTEIDTTIFEIKKLLSDSIFSFYTLGQNMMIGLANGIIAERAYAIGEARRASRMALEGAKQAVNSNSPSKAFEKLGSDDMKGLAIGIRDNAYLAVNEAAKASGQTETAMADGFGGATDDVLNELYASLVSVYAFINAAVNEAIDQTPTITPVLDLSKIQEGAAGIDTALSGTSIGLQNASFAVASAGQVSPYTMQTNLTYEIQGLRSDIQRLAANSNSAALDSIANRMDQYFPLFAERDIVLDSGATVGALAPKMSVELRTLANRRR